MPPTPTHPGQFSVVIQLPPPPPPPPPGMPEDVDAISKFAQFEFQYGEPERGATEFESLVSTYPKRVDLWSVYIDMMLKAGEVKRVRCVGPSL